MSRVSRITKFNPKKTVHENAVMNGVSDAAMYLYLRNNNKGRSFENAKGIVKEIKKVFKEHAGQNLSQAKVAEITGHSVTTINKYWKAAQGKAEIKSTQAERTEKKRNEEEMQIISSISSIAISDILKKAKFSKDVCCLGASFSLFKDNLSMSGFSVEGGLMGDADVISCPSLAELSASFMEECMQAAKKYVAFLMPLSRLSNNQLLESIFKVYPPSLVLPYTSNIGIDGSIINDYAWFLWVKGKNAPTRIEWVQREASQGPSPKALELKKKVDALIEQEHKISDELKDNPSFLPIPTKGDLRKDEHYDMTKHYCIAFRRGKDYWKDIPIPLGNMNGGFEYEMQGIEFPSSEQAYIFGVFSNESEKHRDIQRDVLASKSGYDAKRVVRRAHKLDEREDWGSFNIDWMIYCVWQKVQKNQEFRSILMAIPEGATIIEDTSFKEPDKFWGCVNTDKKAFGSLAHKYAKALGFKTKAARERYESQLLWDYCNVGVYEGKNVMGKILTIIKDCLHKGTEPDIDYDLLESKRIHFYGEPISFDKLESEPVKKEAKPIKKQIKKEVKNPSAKSLKPIKQEYPLEGKMYHSVLGAVIGDIAGSSREGYSSSVYKTDFKFFSANSSITDDTVLTIALADWMNHKESLTVKDALLKWGKMFPNAGYGKGFKQFLKSDKDYLNFSTANGAAMRVSPVAIKATSLEEAIEMAKQSADPTHSGDGAKGAQAIAAAVYLAKNGIENGNGTEEIKAEIKSTIEERFGYDLNLSIEEIRERSQRLAEMSERMNRTGVPSPDYIRISDANLTCPEAIIAVLQAQSYEEAVRLAISMGGDSDTTGAIAGSIAAQLWGIPESLVKRSLVFMPSEVIDVVNEFDGTDFTPTGIAPPRANRWTKNDCVVYGDGPEGQNGEDGKTETIRSRFNNKPVLGYPIPTIGKSLDEIQKSVSEFIKQAKEHPERRYHVRKVGYHKAGYTVQQIAPLFKEAVGLKNVLLPEEMLNELT